MYVAEVGGAMRMEPRTRQRLPIVLLGLLAISALLPTAPVIARTGSSHRWTVAANLGTGIAANDATFVDARSGWAVGNGGTLLATRDGGTSWVQVLVGVSDDLRHVRFADPRRGYAVGGAALLSTADGGASWQRIASPTLPGGLQDLAAPSMGTLVALAAPAGSAAGIWVSADTGITWRQSFAAPAGLALSQLLFTSPASGWACGTAGLFHSADGGQSWASLDLHLAAYQMLAVLPPDTLAIGGVAGATGGQWAATIERSGDNGASWSATGLRPVALAEEASVHALAVAPDGGLVAAGASLSESVDGTTWTRQSLPKGDGPAVSAAGYRGGRPYALAGNSFLLGSAADGTPVDRSSQTATPSATPAGVPPGSPATPGATPTAPDGATATAQAEAIATATPGLVAFATSVPSAVIPFPSAVAAPSLRLERIVPASVVAGSRTRLALGGSGFDALATIGIGGSDIVDAGLQGIGTLTFALPAALVPGTYDVRLTEPDGRTATLHGALTVVPRLTLAARLLHPTIAAGTTAAVLAQTAPGAALDVHVLAPNGRLASGIGITFQRGDRGQWRVLLAVGTHVPAGSLRVVLTARLGTQTARQDLALRVGVGAAHHR